MAQLEFLLDLRLTETSGCTTRWPATFKCMTGPSLAALLVRRLPLLPCLCPSVSCTPSTSATLTRLLGTRLLDFRGRLLSALSGANGL